MPRQVGSFSHPPISTSIHPAQVGIYPNESNTWKLHAALTVFLEIQELQQPSTRKLAQTKIQ